MSEKAHRLAKEHAVDLPGAYSVLLGVMTLEDLAELARAGLRPCGTAQNSGEDLHTYDLDFQPAIDEGLLTPRQASERGQRDAYAAILASKHRLPESVAYDLADNRTSLLEVLRERARQNDGALEVSLRPRRTARTVVLCASLFVVFALAAILQGSGGTVALGPGKELTLGDALARTDGGGRVVMVQGPNPRSVLRAYCAADTRGGRLEPLKTVASTQAGGSARLGLLRDPGRPSELLAIRIREDRKTGVWAAGDGTAPVIPESAPAGAARAVRPAPASPR